ncbi:MAG: arginine--tRNA ligase [Planctomycetota bacterium]|nr:MAG: arginine--tRNA ligase [Planctomycetota bacterium]REJ91150.1 MAG: arginine--tRNA ligase [Planctomycetota bacterium]REK20369.1 MAG: arginine--tRNA ligase [Planctomycetota bacterium]REK26866.1 MAG: arginine--tRNA ligase [Planctomycetota bacterium]
MNILAELRSRFSKALDEFTDDPEPFAEMVRPAQDPRFGDFQANCAMPLAKRAGANPRDLAQQLVDELDILDLCDPPEVAGPGFINLRLRDDWLEAEVNAIGLDEKLGVVPAEKPRKYVVDFSSPNVAKPMHVGHLRSTVIGDALCRVLRALGHDVTSDNHIGDWGTQFGMIIYGYKHFLDHSAYQQDPVGELARLYRFVNTLCDYRGAKEKLPHLEDRLDELKRQLPEAQAEAKADKSHRKKVKRIESEIRDLSGTGERSGEIEQTRSRIQAVESDPALREAIQSHPEIARLVRDETAKLHAGDEENNRLWDEFLPQCIAALERVYERLGVSFDLTLGESHYQPQLAAVVDDLASRKLAVESDGAMCVFIEGNAAPFIVRKSDGAFTYATTDLATIRYRIDELGADAILYVVDARQSEHFDLLFAAARKWGCLDVELTHVTFGTVMGEDGRPFKTRAGDVVGLESLLDQAVAQARKIVDANDDAKPGGAELDDASRAQVAEVVGIGGIKYADLHHNRDSDYIFSWEKMLAKNGDTATYMQYAYARIGGILRKGGVDREQLRSAGERIRLIEPAERALALQICRFPEALEAVAAEYRPNQLTQYLFETANLLSTFYEQCPVLKAEDDSTRNSRLALVDLTGRVIQYGLSLLGIGTCEQM